MKPLYSLLAAVSFLQFAGLEGVAQGTSFTYQGVLREGGVVLNGAVDLTVNLIDAPQDGRAVAEPNVLNDLVVTNGLLNVALDFGPAAFEGQARWLEIAVRPGSSVGAYTRLFPRTQVTAAPYAIYAGTTPASGLVGLISHSSLPPDLARLSVENIFEGSQVFLGGRVGIGTASPGTKLTVVESTYGIEHTDGVRRLATYIDASGCYIGTMSVDPLYFYVSDALSPLMINTNGNVGIGTSNPQAALEVSGTIKGDSFVGDGAGLTGVAAASLSGSILDAQLPGTLARREGGNVFTGDQRIHSGSLHIPNGLLAIGGDVLAGGNQFVAGQLHVGGIFATNAIVAGSFSGDGSGLSGVAQLSGGNNFVGNQLVTSGSLGVGTGNPVSKLDVRGNGAAITVGTSANTEGALHLGNAAHGLMRGFNRVNDVGLYTTSGDVYLSANGTAKNQFVLKNGGQVGLGVLNPAEKLEISGNVRVSGNVSVHNSAGSSKVSMTLDNEGKGKLTCDYIQINGGADIAEPFEVGTSDIQPGMVVSINPDRPGELRLSNRAYDVTVAGVVSGANGIRPGLLLQQKGTLASGHHPIALTGRVWCYCDADAGGLIVPGDMLTSANEPGHAMKAADRDRAFGAILGKAMTPLSKGKALVLVLVSLQ